MIKRYLWSFVLLFALVSCNDLEDTYSDFSGDGVIRYVGKCTDVTVTPGWRKLTVTWDNSVDPTIDKIKISWKGGNITGDSLLNKDATTCDIVGLEDGMYEVSVCGVDRKGNNSLAIPVFGRPYTMNHENVISFSRIIAKHYFVGNRLVLFFSNWDNNVTSASLKYYTVDGELKELSITMFLVYLNPICYLLPDKIDPEKPVVVERSGKIEGCDDIIVFDPYELSHDKLYTTDFKRYVKTKYGLSEVSEAFANSLTELEIDYSYSSLEDILNLPNIEKVILGKNRYLKEEYLKNYGKDSLRLNESASELYEIDRSIKVLEIANELYGLTVDRYNQHFLSDAILSAKRKTLSFMNKYPNPLPPEKQYFDGSTWEISCSEKDEHSFNSHLEYLIDGDLETYWQPEVALYVRTFEITIDMKEVKTVAGIRIVQKDFNPRIDFASTSMLPGIIKIKVSKDQVYWQDAMYMEENTIGDTCGEITIFDFPAIKEAQYIKIIVDDQTYGQYFTTALGEISIF